MRRIASNGLAMTSFQERQKSLFDILDSVETKTTSKADSKETDYGVIDRQTYRKIKSEMKSFRGTESIFKRPEAPINRCLKARTVPGYVKNPKKWQHYTLSDVTADQMSDATNAATAMACLREFEDKEIEKNKMEVDKEESEFKKPTFNLSATLKKGPKKFDNEITYKNNKIVMPEYVVGVSEKKSKKNKICKKDNSVQEKKGDLKLQHLYDDDGDI